MTYPRFSGSVSLMGTLQMGKHMAVSVMLIYQLQTCRMCLFILADNTASHPVLESWVYAYVSSTLMLWSLMVIMWLYYRVVSTISNGSFFFCTN